MRRFFFTILFTALMAASAAAGEKIDMNAKLLNIDGSNIPISPTDPTALTLRKACVDALGAMGLPGDNPDAVEKGKRFWLMLKIQHQKGDLTVDDISLVKKMIGMAYGPIVMGRAYELLDPASVPK